MPSKTIIVAEVVEDIRNVADISEVLDSVINEESKVDLNDLQSIYETTKKAGSDDVKSLTENLTIKGLKEFSADIVATVQKLEEVAKQGKPETVTGGIASRAVKLFNAEETSIGKWLSKKIVEQKIESIEQSTVNQTVANLLKRIEDKRQEAITNIVELGRIREKQKQYLETYKELDVKLTTIIANFKGTISREKFDAEQLGIKVKAAITKINSDISSFIDPILTTAEITIDKIQSMMPDLENHLQTNGAYSSVIETLSTLHDTAATVSELGKSMTRAVHANSKEIIYKSLTALADSGIDVKTYENLAKDEVAHQQKVQALLTTAVKSSEDTYKKISDIQETISIAHEKVGATHLLKR